MRCPTLDQLPPSPQGKSGWPWTEETPRVCDTNLAGQSWPRVSVITPSYNQGQFIEETIRSVLLQGYPNLEYIIIDAASTDDSMDIIRKYERWIAYYVSEPDRGQTDAINKGWRRATGEILAYINTDDCYLNGAVFTAAHEFCATPDVGMVYGSAMVVDEHNKLTKWKGRPFDIKHMFTIGNIVPQPAAFFSRDVLSNVGYLDENWQMIMDYEFCIRVGAQFPAVCVPRTLAKFRNHPQSKSRLRFEETTEELIRFVNDFNPDKSLIPDWQAIKRSIRGRILYESALCCVAQEPPMAFKGLERFLESLSQNPLFALKHPILTAHIMKKVLTGHCKMIARRLGILQSN